MEDSTTPWLAAELMREGHWSPLWAWLTVLFGLAVVVVGAVLFSG